MKGSVTLDFFFSIVLIVVTVTSFLYASYAQIENTVISSTQLKAEAMAMSVGSAINHFAAIEPKKDSEMALDFNGLPEAARTGAFGMPGFAIYASDEECKVKIDTVNRQVTVTVNAYRMDSTEPETITARYPIVPVYGASQEVGCGEGVKLFFPDNKDEMQVTAI